VSIPKNFFAEYTRKIGEIRYENANDAHMRLNHTVIRFLDMPVWASEVSTDEHGVVILLSMLDNSQGTWVSANDERLDVSSVPIGWLNSLNGPMYAERAPVREQKQGWDPQRSHYFVPFQDEDRPMRTGFNIVKGPITGMSVYNMIQGIYPAIDNVTVPEVFPLGAAISFDYCLARPGGKKNGYLLLHRQFPVGYYRPKIRQFIFTNDSLTKTRRRQIEEVISDNGGGYTFHES
jgi:hypothetical protein